MQDKLKGLGPRNYCRLVVEEIHAGKAERSRASQLFYVSGRRATGSLVYRLAIHQICLF